MYNIVKVVIKSVFFTTPLLTDEYNCKFKLILCEI